MKILNEGQFRVLITGGIAAGLLFAEGVASAQPLHRAWVSRTGSNANSGRIDAPILTLSDALNEIEPGGEISALDSLELGAAIVSKSVTIDGKATQSTIDYQNQTRGIYLQAGPADVVTLRNLTFNGLGSGYAGIEFLSGAKLVVENCTFSGSNYGIVSSRNSTGYIKISDCTFSNMVTAAVLTLSNGANTYVSIENVKMDNCVIGVSARNGTRLTLRNSVLSSNATGLSMDQGGSLSKALIDNCAFSQCSTAFKLNASSTARFIDTSFMQNFVVFQNNGGVFESNGTNTMTNNGTNGPAPVPVSGI